VRMGNLGDGYLGGVVEAGDCERMKAGGEVVVGEGGGMR